MRRGCTSCVEHGACVEQGAHRSCGLDVDWFEVSSGDSEFFGDRLYEC